ncbi:uncharacterized protein LOC144104613 isoform X2 [Amblyomma americanum]
MSILGVMFSCEACSQLFSTRDSLGKHRQREHPQGPPGRHCCIYCPFSSDDKANVTRHQRTHTGERPFVCEFCKKAFTQLENLNRHLVVHTGERPYKCADCDQRFADASNLARHRKLHTTGDGYPSSPHVCPDCGRVYAYRRHFTRHLQTHIAKKPFAYF